MRKFFVYLLSLLVLVTCYLDAEAKKSKKKTAESEPVRLEWKAFTPYDFQEGTILVRGRLTGFAEGQMPSNVDFNGNNLFSQQPSIYAVPVAADGSFEMELNLPHSQFVFSRTLQTNVFLAVGDTLDIELNGSMTDADGGLLDGAVRYSGSAFSSQVNRQWKPIWRQLMKSCVRMGNPIGMSLDQLREADARYNAMADSLAVMISAGKVPFTEPVCDKAREVMEYSMMSAVMTKLQDARLYYKEGRNVFKQAENGKTIVEKNPNFVPLDSVPELNRFFVRWESTLFDTPLMLLGGDNWVPFNRVSFDQYFREQVRIVQFLTMKQINQVAPESDTLAVYRDLWSVMWDYTLPRHYSSGSARALKLQCPNGMVLADSYFNNYYDDLKQRYGLGHTFALDVYWVKEAMDNMKEKKDYDERLAIVDKYLQQVQNPIVHRRLLQLYHDFVLENEDTKSADESAPITNELLKQELAPYEGYALYVDFWNMGCGPCRMSMLEQRKLVDESAGKKVKFIYISNDEGRQRELAEKWMADNNIKGEHLWVKADDWNEFCAYLQFNAIPFAIVVSPEGGIVAKGNGNDVLSKFIEKYLK